MTYQAAQQHLDDAIDLFNLVSGAQIAHDGTCSRRPAPCRVCATLAEAQDHAWVAWIAARNRLAQILTDREGAREHAE